jgi:uncharacterized protein (DUF486 family)
MEHPIPPFVYVKFFGLWLTSTIISIIGMYAHLKYPNQPLIQALSMALPFAWVDWFFMTMAMDINNKYKIMNPTQDIMFLIIAQYTILLILNRFYLKQKVTVSDLVAWPIMLLGFAVSGFHIVSKLLGRKIVKKSKRRRNK